MKRRSLSSATLAVLLGACAGAPKGGAVSGEVEHVVLVWLKDPGDRAVRERMIATARTFPERIPGFVSFSVGAPLQSGGDAVDDTFTVGLVMRFRDVAALRAYEANPVHVQAVQELLVPSAAKFVIYDVLAR